MFSLAELEQRFDIDKVQKGGARFDRERLEWVNGQWIRRLERRRPRRAPAAVPRGGRSTTARSTGRRPTTSCVALLPIVRERLPTLAAIVDLVGFLWRDDLDVDPAILVPEALGRRDHRGRPGAARDVLAAHDGVTWEADELEPPLRALVEARGWKAGDLFMAIRVATTGRTATPPLFDTLVALGRDRTLARLDAAIARLGRRRRRRERIVSGGRRCADPW